MSEENTSNQQAELISLIKNLVYNFVSLISKHIKLFREEIKEEVFTVVKSAILMLIAFSLVIIAAFFGGILLIITFALFASVWWSILFVTILYLLTAAILFAYAKSQFKKIDKNRKKFAEEAAKTLEETKKWLEHLKS
jgi:uncharacterized membrane protein YqjE